MYSWNVKCCAPVTQEVPVAPVVNREHLGNRARGHKGQLGLWVLYLISLNPRFFKNIAHVGSFVLYYDMRIWWSSYDNLMMMTRCQDHILTENMRFVWSKTSYRWDKWRCYHAGRRRTTKREDRATQRWILEGWVSQNLILSDKCYHVIQTGQTLSLQVKRRDLFHHCSNTLPRDYFRLTIHIWYWY